MMLTQLVTQPEIVSVVDLIMNSRLSRAEKLNALLCNTKMPAFKALELVRAS